MTCVEVRDRLTEHTLGVLDGDDRRRVQRHLEWCAGCRKEAAEMQEGLETIALSLAPARPPASLEERIVRETLAAAGKRPSGSRRRTVRVLAAATLAAALLALGAMGWGFAERQRARNFEEEVQRAAQNQRGLANLVESFRAEFRSAGKVFDAELYPGLVPEQPAGTAVVFTVPGTRGFALVEVAIPLPAAEGPFTVELLDASGHVLPAGTMTRRGDGHHVLSNLDLTEDLSRAGSVELSHLASINVVTSRGFPVLTGSFRPYATTSPTP